MHPRGGRNIVAISLAAAAVAVAPRAEARPRGADEGSGEKRFALSPSYRAALGDGVSLGLSMPLSYRAGGGGGGGAGADALDFAVALEMPLDVIRPAGPVPLGLRITPFGVVAGSAAGTRDSGAFSGDGGVSGTASLALGALEASFSSRISRHEGMNVSYESLRLEPAPSRQTVEHGLRLSRPLGGGALVFGTLSHTRAIQDAAIEDRIRPGAGLSWQRPGGFDMSIVWQADLSRDFAGEQQVRFNLQVPF